MTAAVRAFSGASALLLALAWLLASAGPAAAVVTGYRIDTPGSGTVVRAAAELVVVVDHTREGGDAVPEQVEVASRLAGETDDGLLLEQTGARETGPGAQQLTFAAPIDPDDFLWQGGGVAPNGYYRIEVQWRSQRGEVHAAAEDWIGVDIVLDVPPPATTATASAGDGGIDVSWDAVDVPDLLGYVVERSAGGGPWQAAGETDTGTTAFHDPVDAGAYRYRVVARRAGAGPGEELRSQSEPTAVVTFEPAEPPPTEPPPTDAATEDPGTPSEEPGPTEGPGEEESELTAPPGADGHGDDVAEPTEDPTAAVQDDDPVLEGAPPASSPGVAAPPGANTTYDPVIDYGVDVTGEKTTRVPVDIPLAQEPAGGGSVLRVHRTLDQQRVLPAVAGGLVLMLSAAHVIRFLHA